ncbi:hypothetical protein GLOIN_2v1472929 [Rhizophagus irregularis DAOM 181602=DAOM 197198]|nr:hypothetical protein GLOIN_2v1472929 [Rhizophagus irregularis DAOM 181602=DAOM 197198]
MRADKGKVREIPEERPKTDMEREWEAANGIIDDWDEEDTEGAINDILIARTLPTRFDIKELQYSGARFSRGAIARLGQTLQTRFPDRKFQILLPYENWKPGGWTSGNQPASLFSLLDHYDEAQLPDDADPDYFERFIIYARDSPPAAGGCNRELNDCLFNRDAPIPVSCMDKVEQLAGSLAINIVGDITESLRSQYTTAKQLSLAQLRSFKKLRIQKFFHPVEKNRKTGVYELLKKHIRESRGAEFLSTGDKEVRFRNRLIIHNWSYKRTALWLFERLSVGIPANDPLDPIEAEWLSDAMMGGLIWADKSGRAMEDSMTQQVYTRGGIAGRVAKRVLNTLWGALCQRKRNYKTLTTDQTDPFTFPEGHTLDSIIPVGSDQWRFQFTNPGNPSKVSIQDRPFLLARGRKITSEAIQLYKDKVRRIHTDGFILEEQPDSPALFTCSENADTTLKTFKFETAGYCHVKNANKVIWT